MPRRSVLKMAAGLTRGFTLIELMLVISIISILTLVAVYSYSAVQREARLDFAADSLVAAIREQQMLARSGRVAGADGGSPKNQCFNLKFEMAGAANDGNIYSSSSDYVGLPTEAGSAVDSCTMVADGDWQKRDIIDSGIQLKELKNCASVPVESPFLLYFKPPFARTYQVEGAVLKPLSNELLQFDLQVSGNAGEHRFIQFNLVTGEVKRVLSGC